MGHAVALGHEQDGAAPVGQAADGRPKPGLALRAEDGLVVGDQSVHVPGQQVVQGHRAGGARRFPAAEGIHAAVPDGGGQIRPRTGHRRGLPVGVARPGAGRRRLPEGGEGVLDHIFRLGCISEIVERIQAERPVMRPEQCLYVHFGFHRPQRYGIIPELSRPSP